MMTMMMMRFDVVFALTRGAEGIWQPLPLPVINGTWAALFVYGYVFGAFM